MFVEKGWHVMELMSWKLRGALLVALVVVHLAFTGW